jgi:ribonuclease I
MQVHTHWIIAPEDVGIEFEWRLVSCAASSEFAHKDTHTFKAEKRRLRYRLKALSVISTGETLLRCEWRKKGEGNWQRSQAFWPIVIEFKEKPVAEQIVSPLEK